MHKKARKKEAGRQTKKTDDQFQSERVVPFCGCSEDGTAKKCLAREEPRMSRTFEKTNSPPDAVGGSTTTKLRRLLISAGVVLLCLFVTSHTFLPPPILF